MQTDPHYTDGYFGTTLPTSAAPVIKRPFKGSTPPDTYARRLTRRFLVDPRSDYSRIATRTAYTNYLPYSEDFSNAAWTKSELTRTAAALANPWDGTSTFSKFLETITNAEHVLSAAFTFTAVAHTVSALIAPGLGRSYVRLKANDGTTDFTAFFNLTDGVVFGTPANCTATIKRYSDGSCKCSITFTPAAAAGNAYVNSSTNGSTVSYVGDVTKGFYCGGVQVERASSAGPYIVTTSASRTISSPDVDGLANIAGVDPDDFSYLVDETDIDGDSSAPAVITRTYARIPARQTLYSSRFLQRPVLHDVTDGSAWGVSFDNGVSSWIFTGRKTISVIGSIAADTKAVAGTISGTGTISGSGTESGSGTISFAPSTGSLPSSAATFVDSGGHSQAINLNTAASSVQSSLASALTSLTSITVTSTQDSLTISWVGTMKSITTSAAVSIEGSAATNVITFRVPSTGTNTRGDTNTRATVDTRATTDTHAITETYSVSASKRIFTATAHGGSVGDRVAFYNGSRIVALSIVTSVPDANNFYVPLEDVPGADFGTTSCVFSSAAVGRVHNGSTPGPVSHKESTDFYLPGVSAGIASPLDIAVIVTVIDPVSWLTTLAAWIAGGYLATTLAVVDGTPLERWLDGPIYSQTTVSVQLKDAIETLPTGA